MLAFLRLFFRVLWALAASVAAGCASTAFTSELTDSSNLPEYGIGGRRAQEDRADRYGSVVMVVFPDNSFCSGVMITPRHVLTAAHCFCLPPGFERRQGTHVYDDTDQCTKTAKILSVSHHGSGDGEGIALPLTGKAVIHPDFSATVINGRIGRQVADLAVVQLASPLADINPDGNMPERDVSYAEVLTIVGYGPSTYQGGDGGIRRFGTNTVTKINTNSEVKEFRMGPQGVHPFGGDSGAPCFRESKEGRWLVGINYGFLARGVESESWFMNTFHFRAWIEEQKRRRLAN